MNIISMKYTTKVYRLTVTQIVNTYMNIPFSTRSKQHLKHCQYEHKKNGYNNKKMYERYYVVSIDTLLHVRGIPDRVDPPYVVEFKTCTHRTLETVVDYAEVQLHLYMWLTGLQKGRIDVYLKDTKELIKGYRYVYYDPLFVDKILKTVYYKLYNGNTKRARGNSQTKTTSFFEDQGY